MNVKGQNVLHNIFGSGKIIEHKGDILEVRFSNGETKTFKYPASFEKFLKPENSSIWPQIEKDIFDYKLKEEASLEREKRVSFLPKVQHFTKSGRVATERQDKVFFVKKHSSVDSFCNYYIDLLEKETTYIRSTGSKHIMLYDGKRIGVNKGHFVYTFESDTELHYPDGMPINIWRKNESEPGAITSCEDFTVTISTDVFLGDDVKSLEISVESWRLIQSLSDRLEELKRNPSIIVRDLVCYGKNNIDNANSVITTGQDNAVKMSKSQPITFVWGPPGTGKTQTLAKIALEHITKGNKVLMLSYSNVSVDGAIMRTYSMAQNLPEGSLIRYGYPRDKQLIEHESLTAHNYIINKFPYYKEKRKELYDKRRSTPKNSIQYHKINEELRQLENRFKDSEKATVINASFVATTVTKAVVDGVIKDGIFDVVIFDEASMAYIPQVVYAASIAKKHFICMGDFRQLPPIVQSEEAEELNADIFQYCGINTAVDTKKNHKWLCMLDTQYRMHPQIADFASITMYNGLLKSAEGMEGNREDIKAVAPFKGVVFGLVDLSGMMSVCWKTHEKSNVNVLSALISFALALNAAKYKEVGIITPYNAQSRLLHAMSRDAHKIGRQISCATVHQFQGSEKDVIIYDAVDCYRSAYPGMMLTSMNNNYANRLFNVAVTRAKGKFIGITNVDYMHNKGLSSKLMFERFIQNRKNTEDCYTGDYFEKTRKQSIINFYSKKDAFDPFVEDLSRAKKEIRIDIPGKVADDALINRLVTIIENVKKKGVSVYVRAEDKNGLPASIRNIAIQNPYIVNPLVVIDKGITWFGMPYSEAEFIAEGHTIKTKYRPIIRFEGSYTARAIYNISEMSSTLDMDDSISYDDSGNKITNIFSKYVLATKKCPKCHRPMKLIKSKKTGKFFLGCTGYPICQSTEFVETELVEDYFYNDSQDGKKCPRCGCSLTAHNGPFGVYVQCEGLYGHKYKLDEI